MLGNEGQGLSPEVQASCDGQVAVPMADLESLNVAVAGSILMHVLGPFAGTLRWGQMPGRRR